jgi:hypothetical protein
MFSLYPRRLHDDVSEPTKQRRLREVISTFYEAIFIPKLFLDVLSNRSCLTKLQTAKEVNADEVGRTHVVLVDKRLALRSCSIRMILSQTIPFIFHEATQYFQIETRSQGVGWQK